MPGKDREQVEERAGFVCNQTKKKETTTIFVVKFKNSGKDRCLRNHQFSLIFTRLQKVCMGAMGEYGKLLKCN